MAFTINNDPTAPVRPAGVTDQSEPDAVDFDILAAAHAGYGVVLGCAVTAGAGAMQVSVAAGVIAIAGRIVTIAAQPNLTVTAADPTNNRIDLVIVNTAGTASVSAGTAAVNACMPNVIDGASVAALAAVMVTAADVTIGAADVTDKRCLLTLPGGVSVWENQSTATRSSGFVAVYDNAGDDFDVVNAGTLKRVIGVLLDDNVAVGGFGRIQHGGYCAKVNTNGAVTAGQFLIPSTTSLGRAKTNGTIRGSGVFGVALTTVGVGDNTVEAFLLGGDMGFPYAVAAGADITNSGAPVGSSLLLADQDHGHNIVNEVALAMGMAGTVAATADTADFLVPMPFAMQITRLKITYKTKPTTDATIQLRDSADGTTFANFSSSALFTAAGEKAQEFDITDTPIAESRVLNFSVTGGGNGVNIAVMAIGYKT